MMEESFIREIRNFTATGFKSELLEQLVKMTPIGPEIARAELEDYLLVKEKLL